MVRGLRRWHDRLAIVALAGLLTLLAGCVDVKAHAIVTNDREVSLNLEYWRMHEGYGAPDPCARIDPLLPAGVHWRRMFRVGNVGQMAGCRMEGVMTLADLEDNRYVSLTHTEGRYAFRALPTLMELATAGQKPLADPDFALTVTFPGRILSHTGDATVTGTTITWTSSADLTSPQGLRALAEDSSRLLIDRWTLALLLAGAGAAGALLTAVFGPRTRKKDLGG